MTKFKHKQQNQANSKNEPDLEEIPADNQDSCSNCGENPADTVEADSITAQLEEKNRLLDEMTDKYKRLCADFDNFRRRTVKEKEDIGAFATERVVCELLPVVDNFERALDMASSTDDAGSLRTGLEMIFRQFEATLTRLGVEPIEAVGCQFDPAEHEAVARVAAEDKPDEFIVSQVQKGYKLKGRVIRPSMVNVVGN